MEKKLTQNDFPGVGWVVPSALNMRKKPSGEIIKVLFEGSIVEVVPGKDELPITHHHRAASKDNFILHWLKVKVGEDVGYVVLEFIRFN